MGATLRLKVPHQHIKTVKTALEASRNFTGPLSLEYNVVERYSIITAACNDAILEHSLFQAAERHGALLAALNIYGLDSSSIEVLDLVKDEVNFPGLGISNETSSERRRNPVGQAIASWLLSVATTDLLAESDVAQLTASANAGRYQVYPPMLLFSAGAFESEPWQDLLVRLPAARRNELFESVAQTVRVTHIAVNAPIPRELHNAGNSENVIRSPSNLKPLHGDFGPVISDPPTPADFDDALWVSSTQNGIVQTWAPRYTMFSRGNVTEKTRLLASPSVLDAIAQGRQDGHGCSAVDLYAGIGYFAFSYIKAGVDKVLCFDINPWSVEGLRRGAEANRWGVTVVRDADRMHSVAEEALEQAQVRLLAFETSNEHAEGIVDYLRGTLPPVRHVNCGLLPSSRGCWATAVRVLDPTQGGWLHLHENMAIDDIDAMATMILAELTSLSHDRSPARSRAPVLEHVQRVKTYAPGIMHCVLDIYVPPI